MLKCIFNRFKNREKIIISSVELFNLVFNVSIEESEVPTIYVGKRNMSYYLNVCIKLLDKGYGELIIEGMGKNIIKAVDVVNFLNKFYEGSTVEVKNVKIDMVSKGVIRGLPKYVSRIKIHISKSK